MAFSLFDAKGTPIEGQCFTWRELVQTPISKLDDDAFTRVRILLMHGIEVETLQFGHQAARCHDGLRLPLAQVRRCEQHQATLIRWLVAADHSPLETTIACEQTAIEVTAAMAQREPDPSLAQVYRFTLLEHCDHLYRHAALLDRMEGKDANNILQSYTDVLPGRPTAVQHRAPEDELRLPYQRASAALASKLHVLTAMSLARQVGAQHMQVGPQCADPLARQLCAEIASVAEQHATLYGCLSDPAETWIEQWLLHEANECYLYYSCVEQESNHHVKAIWERFLDYELGHFQLACAALRQLERRDPVELIAHGFADPFPFRSQRAFVRKTAAAEMPLRAHGPRITAEPDSAATGLYRRTMHADGIPSEAVAAGYAWMPGTELYRKAAPINS
jgi:hypothetical protein